MPPVKVAIVDDHLLVLQGFVSLLSNFKGIEIIIEAASGKELFQHLQARQPDILLLDIQMPEMDGFQVAAMMKAQYPEVKIIVLTQFDNEKFVHEMLKEGARGYLLKDANAQEVQDAIHSVMRTGYYLNDNISAKMLNEFLESGNFHPIFSTDVQLTDREEEVLLLICEQRTTCEIAKELNLSESTIKGNREQLFEKTGARTVVGLALFAVFTGRIKALPDSFDTSEEES